MKAADISDEVIYELVAAARFADGKPSSLMIWEACEKLPQYPAKIVRAKLQQMVSKGRLRGCECGKCRGDYRFPWEEFGSQSYASRQEWREKISEYLHGGKRVYGY